MPPHSAAYLYSWPGQFLFVGSALNTHVHKHHALQLVISLDTPFRMQVNQLDWQTHSAILIASDHPHECLADDSTILFLNLDPESETARKFRLRYLRSTQHHELPIEWVAPFVESITSLLPRLDGCQAVRTALQLFCNQLTDTSEPVSIDDRILTVKNRLAHSLQQPAANLATLAAEACLSESRLVHLFKEQVGLPIRQYVLWQRLLKAIAQISEGRNLTQAAHEAGFADSAHFSRTFTRMFGLSPSLMTKNSQFLQARVCS